MNTYATASDAFAALCALDPENVHRSELRAAGVNEHRIAALYGRPFPALVPHIISHFKAIEDADLLAQEPVDPDSVDKAWAALPPRIFDLSEVDDDADEEALRAQGLGMALPDGLADRFEEIYLGSRPTPWPNLSANQIATAIWCVHWMMSNRSILTPKAQQRADELMLAVARTINL